jgi:hypothetical protein
VRTQRRGPQRKLSLAVAAVLVAGGMLLTLSAPGSNPASNKADAYGTATPTKPTNPKNKSECTKYYGPSRAADARECGALATRNGALARCAKKHGAAQKACKKAAATAYAKERAKIAKQRSAEKLCSEAFNAELAKLNTEDPEYSQKISQISAAESACLTKAQA